MDTESKKVVNLRPQDLHLSSVEEELDALDIQLSTIAKELTNIEQWNDSGKAHAIKTARRSIDRAVQRSYRAKQISRGLRVNKPT